MSEILESKICLQCGEEFFRHCSYPCWRAQKYCSRRCFKIGIRIDIDENEVVYLYIREQMSTTKIANIMVVSPMTIHRILKRQGIERRKCWEYPITAKTRRKISQANKGRILSKETKEKIRLRALGRVFSLEHKESLSTAHIGNDGYWTGKHRNPETKEKIRRAISGENHPHWRGGISNNKYSIKFNKEIKELIRKRDNYTCQLCGVSECECLNKLPIHHIDYNKQNCLPSNLLSLCGSCNSKVNWQRKKWTKYFRNRNLLQPPLVLGKIKNDSPV